MAATISQSSQVLSRKNTGQQSQSTAPSGSFDSGDAGPPILGEPALTRRKDGMSLTPPPSRKKGGTAPPPPGANQNPPGGARCAAALRPGRDDHPARLDSRGRA